MNTKMCKQCGEVLPIAKFRSYYGGRRGTYTMCLDCERVNTREKYLRRKIAQGKATDEQRAEYGSIHELWDLQASRGLTPPGHKHTACAINLENMLENARRQAAVPHGPSSEPELIKWLTEPLTEHPDYYVEDVYERLVDTYRPVLRIDRKTLLPVHDESNIEVLSKILSRFHEYEANYWRDNDE